ncbi:MAG: DPP IV N-terminal domain-containing protein [Ilumatobacteraceae bacterium]
MGRSRGHWWSPDGRHVAACRVDETEVPSWWIGNPARPDQPAVEHRYPAAGSQSRRPAVRARRARRSARPRGVLGSGQVRVSRRGVVASQGLSSPCSEAIQREVGRARCRSFGPGRRHRSRSTPTTVGSNSCPACPDSSAMAAS